jgi:hypothetical protein
MRESRDKGERDRKKGKEAKDLSGEASRRVCRPVIMFRVIFGVPDEGGARDARLCRLGFATFEDLLTHVLCGGFDLLHLLADAGAGGLIATDRLIYVVFGFLYQALQGLEFLHGYLLQERVEVFVGVDIDSKTLLALLARVNPGGSDNTAD